MTDLPIPPDAGAPLEAPSAAAATKRPTAATSQPPATAAATGNQFIAPLTPAGGWAVDGTLKAIAERIGFTVEPSVIKELRRLDGLFEKAWECLNHLGAQRIHALMTENIERGVEAVLAGEPEQLQTAALTKDYLKSDYITRKRALKAGLSEVGKRALAVAKPEIERFAQEALKAVDRMDESGRKEARALKVKYEPAIGLIQIRQAVAVQLDKLNVDPLLYASSRPSQLLMFL